MRRVSRVVFIVVLTLGLTMSLAIAGMRVNRVTFTALADAGGTTSLMAASTDTQESEGDICSASTPCVGLSLNAEGVLTGISDQIADAAVVDLMVQGVPASVTCTNSGGQEAPGQNPVVIVASGQQLVTSAGVTKRGTAPLDLTATFPTLSYPGDEMGCPNSNWTATIDAVRFTCATIRVTEGSEVVLEQRYALDGSCAG